MGDNQVSLESLLVTCDHEVCSMEKESRCLLAGLSPVERNRLHNGNTAEKTSAERSILCATPTAALEPLSILDSQHDL